MSGALSDAVNRLAESRFPDTSAVGGVPARCPLAPSRAAPAAKGVTLALLGLGGRQRPGYRL